MSLKRVKEHMIDPLFTGKVNEHTTQIENVTTDLAQRATKQELQQISLSYKESYATLAELQTAYPTGDIYNHSVLADGFIYTYVNSVWTSAGIQANGTGIANKTVTPSKLANTKPKKNLFDKSTTTNGGYKPYDSGGFTVSASHFYSDYIAVLAQTTYRVNKNYVHVCFYDSAKTYLSGHLVDNTAGTRTIPTPLSCAFVIISTDITSKDTLQLELGDKETSYEPFQYIITDVKFEWENVITKDGSISVKSLKDIINATKNLFNKAEVVTGYQRNNTGVTSVNANYFYLDNIIVSGNTAYTLNVTFTYVCFYDDLKNFISGILITNIRSEQTFTTPANCASLAISSNNVNLNVLQIETGTEQTFYEPYRYNFINLLPDSAREVITARGNDPDLKTRLDNMVVDFSIFDLAYVKNQKLVANYNSTGGNTAKYTGVDIGATKKPTSIRCKAIFENSGAITSMVCLISNPNGLYSVKNITDKSVHVIFTNTGIAADVYLNGVKTALAYYNFVTPCLLDGVTEYEFGFRVSGDTITFENPDGTENPVTFTGLQDYLGQYCTLEHYWNQPSNVAKAQYTYFEILGTGVKVVDRFRRNNGAIGVAPTGQVYVQINETNQT